MSFSNKNIISILSRKGYLIEKSSLTIQQLDKIKKDLIVQPFVKNNYGRRPEKFTTYLENEKRICVPKFYGLKVIGKPTKIIEPKYTKIKVKFNGKLKERQIEPFKKTIKGIKENGGGVLSIPCGWGKTVLALKLICDLKVKTLVIVHKTFLVNQWKERIEQFIPKAKIGMIQQDTIDTEGKDIVIGMLQSISMKEYDKSVFGDFGFVVSDEVHRISSKIFSRALPKTSAKYTLGLSATPNRDDGLSKIFHWYLGDMLYQKTQAGNKSVVVKCYNFKSGHSKFKEIINKYTKKASNSVMVTNLGEIEERNDFILNIIVLVLTQQKYIDDENAPKRQILILSDRIKHLEILKTKLDNMKICTTGYYIGKMKEEQLKESSVKDVILGTYPMASEGLDIPSLNTLILATPRSKITQSVGRILRKERSDISPLVIDIIDMLSIFKGQGYRRRSFYKKKKYRTEFYDVLDGDITGVGPGRKSKNNNALPDLAGTMIINNEPENKQLIDIDSDSDVANDGFISSSESDSESDSDKKSKKKHK